MRIKEIPSLQEQSLWNNFRAGDEVAFTQLSTRYYKMFRHYGEKFTTNSQIIEDAIQDLLVNLWVKRTSLSEVDSVKFYLLKSFRNQLFKTLRAFSAVPFEDDFQENFSEASSEMFFIENESQQEQQSKISYFLKQLPDRQREILYLRFYQDLRVEEIAQLLQIKPQSVSNIIQRALLNLRQHWELLVPFILLWLL
jgi:RNA polymerase sigma factor (sigma-70 family)